LIYFIRLLLVATGAVIFFNGATAREMPEISEASIVARYGKPDKVTTAANEKPRAPLVTKMIEYKRENVRFVLIANGPIGSPPPYKSWKLMGFQDPRNNKVLTGQEVEDRLARRIKRK
jgi:hypothetical protein